jgi:hypothetical protein
MELAISFLADTEEGGEMVCIPWFVFLTRECRDKMFPGIELKCFFFFFHRVEHTIMP